MFNKSERITLHGNGHATTNCLRSEDTQGDKKSMGLDTQTMLKAEKGLCRPCRQSELRKRQIAGDSKAASWLAHKNLWRDVWPWGGHDF